MKPINPFFFDCSHEFCVSMSAAAVGPRRAGTSPLVRTAAWPRLHLHTLATRAPPTGRAPMPTTHDCSVRSLRRRSECRVWNDRAHEKSQIVKRKRYRLKGKTPEEINATGTKKMENIVIPTSATLKYGTNTYPDVEPSIFLLSSNCSSGQQFESGQLLWNGLPEKELAVPGPIKTLTSTLQGSQTIQIPEAPRH